jgi:hypothetical protein
MTAVGPVVVRRMNLVCVGCRDSVCPLDGRLGLTAYLSPQATRLCCLAGGSWSFDRAAEHLNSFCGIHVSDELIRHVSGRCAPKIAAFAATAREPVATFAPAQGDVEFETDAVKVNTVEGWRDAKIGIFAKRPRGPAAEAADWATRTLPKPTARFAFAAIEESTDFALRWGATATRLGIDPRAAELTVLGDGAEWIWNRAGEQFPNAAGVLDIFHAAEKIADATAVLFAASSDATTQRERGRSLLLSDGYAGFTDWIGEVVGQPAVGGDGAALGTLMNYFAGHKDRLNYALRLRRGQSIGSGMVEGAAKNMIGKRLKANNARWCESNVNRMGSICSAMYSGYWDDFWACN